MRGVDTGWLEVPGPAVCGAVWEPYETPVPYSTHQVVALPLGLTLPPTVACVWPIPLAAPVTTVGEAAGGGGGGVPPPLRARLTLMRP